MGADADAEAQIPILDFGKQGLVLEGLEQLQGSDEKWKAMCMKVREACENHGWFVLKCDESIIPKSLRQEMFVAMKALFDLPEETKQKHTSPKPYNSYLGKCPVIPLSESFGVDEAAQLDVARAFTNVMWPQGNPSFCETINSMSSKLLEMNFMVLRMILESFGLMEKYYESHLENTSSVFRLMKYKVPPPSDDDGGGGAAIGLVPHTDKNSLTILFQNDVQGLDVLTKQGNWVQLEIPEGSFTVIVGDTLKAWSNGRLHAPRHRVKLRGIEKERYSCGLFLLPKEGMVIEVPQELIDKDHPLLYRPFKYQDYLTYFVSNITDDALELFAGL